ncbi:MAG TPA: helix-turn-helix domain-containing protein [Steroidobacteraceae bacterium]
MVIKGGGNSVRTAMRLAVPPPESASAKQSGGRDIIRYERYSEPMVNGTLDFARLLWLGIGRVRADAHRVFHRPEPAGAAAPEQHVMLQVSGRSLLEQSGCTLELPAVCWTAPGSQPYAVVSDVPSERIVLLIDQKHLSQKLRRPHGVGGVHSAATGWGRLLLSCATHLSDELPHVPSGNAGSLAELFTLLLRQALRQEFCGNDEVHADDSREQVLRYVRPHLRDPKLTVGRVAEALGWSPRKVNRVFARGDETLSEYIRWRRLEGVYRDLHDPAQRSEPLHQIVLSWGFRDYPSFCRAFRVYFGITPKAMRRQAVTSPGST